MAEGKLFVMEGIDGSGKATQAQRLYEELLQKGIKVKKVSFPDYASDSSSLVRMYLDGQFGNRPGDVNPYAASSFYAVDRYASFKRNWEDFYGSGGVVISDRYTTSNAIHQCAKLPQEEWDDFLQWLFHYEYDLLGLPSPNRVFFLATSASVTEKLLLKRYSGDPSREDIHEADRIYMENAAKAADYCCASLEWTKINCVQQGSMRTVEDIHEEILSLLGL